MTYTVAIVPSVSRDMKKLPGDVRASILRRIEKLAEDPCGPGAEKVRGVKHCFRVRQGNYRIIYGVFDESLRVLVVRVGHRSEVYRDAISWLRKAMTEGRRRPGHRT